MAVSSHALALKTAQAAPVPLAWILSLWARLLTALWSCAARLARAWAAPPARFPRPNLGPPHPSELPKLPDAAGRYGCVATTSRLRRPVALRLAQPPTPVLPGAAPAGRGDVETVRALLALGAPPVSCAASLWRCLGYYRSQPQPGTLRLLLAHRRAAGVEFRHSPVHMNWCPDGLLRPPPSFPWQCPIHFLLQQHLNMASGRGAVHGAAPVRAMSVAAPCLGRWLGLPAG